MNKFVTSALALAAAGSVSYADPGDDEWLELDSEINNLASALQPSSQDGMGWSVLFRASYAYSSDGIATSDGNAATDDSDLSGFNFEDVDFAFWGSVAEYGWRVSFDLDQNYNVYGSLAGGTPSMDSVQLQDIFAYWDCGGYVTATFGSLKANTFRSGTIDPENQLFIDRSVIGSAHDFWDLGVQADGEYEAFSYWISIQDGLNGNTSDHYYSARVEWDFNAGAGTGEGAMGGNDELNLTVGGAYVNNDSNDTAGAQEDSLYGLDVAGNFSSFGFAAEVAFLDDESFRATSGDYGAYTSNAFGVGMPLFLVGDSTPWALMGSFLINPEWEVGVRYESLDNGSIPQAGGGSVAGPDNTVLTLGVAWYRSGNNAKWTAQWSNIDADSGFEDGSIFQVGLTLGATR
jgi:hypothetical protein